MPITNKKRITATIMLCCLLPGIGFAEYTVYGPGRKSCGEWLEDRKSFTWVSDIFWLSGWLSAAGYYGIADLKTTSSDAMAAYVDTYCQENPLSDIDDAAMALVKSLDQKNE